MVDPVDVLFIEAASDLGVEGPRGREVVPEWFLDDEARPASGGLVGLTSQTGFAQLFHDRSKQSGRRGEVKEPPRARARSAVKLLEPAPQFRVALRVIAVVLTRNVGHSGGEVRPRRLVARSRFGQHRLSHPGAELIVRHLAAGVADQAELRREHTALRQPKDGGHDHSLRQVAGSAEEYQCAGFRLTLCFRGDVRQVLSHCFVRHHASPLDVRW